APRTNRVSDRARLHRIAALLADGREDVGDDAEERAKRQPGLDAVLPARPRARKDLGDLLEVVEEEPLRALAEPFRLPAAERVERREDALQLLGERSLRDAAATDAEELDLALQGGVRVLVECADDVVARRELLVGVEAAPRQADQVRGIELRVLR